CAGLPIRLGRLPSLIIARVIVAIIKIPKKKIPGPNVKEKRKAGTRAGLTKPAIAAAAKLIESIGPNGFSLRKLAKALGVGPILLLMFFGIQNGGFLRFRKRSNTQLYNALADPEPNRPSKVTVTIAAFVRPARVPAFRFSLTFGLEVFFLGMVMVATMTRAMMREGRRPKRIGRSAHYCNSATIYPIKPRPGTSLL